MLSPIEVRGRRIPNRLVFLPHGNRYPLDDLPGERELFYYGERARAGVGLIIFGSQTVHTLEGAHVVNATNPAVVDHYQRLTDAVHRHGTLIHSQLVHWGVLRQTAADFGLDWQPPYGSSSRPRGETFTREMDAEHLKRALDAYVLGARHAVRGGFDGIELRMNHALLQEFVSPLVNRRTDEYGGSIENRLQFPLEVLRAIRDEAGDRILIDVRFCVDEVIPGGYGLDEGVRIGRILEATGLVDILTVGVGATPDGGIFQTEEIPPYPQPEGYAVYAAAALKQAVSLPVVACGRITMPRQAEQIIAAGQADFAGVARALITDPEWLLKAREGRVEDIRRCLGYNEVCLRPGAHRVTCVWNPAAGREQTLGIGTLAPAGKPKRVAVIGGGPAGLKVADTAARRGHAVTLIEQTAELGGQINLAVRFPNRAHLGEIPAYYRTQLEKLGVDIRLNTVADPELIASLDADTTIIATGAVALVPGIPGAGHPNVFTVWDLARGIAFPGDRVLVYDSQGLWPGLSAVEMLAKQGKQVVFATPRNGVGVSIAAGPLLLWNERIADCDVTRWTETALAAIDGSVVTLANTNTRLPKTWTAGPFDSVILSCGGRPNDDLYRRLKGTVADLRIVGDCEAPLRVEKAIYSAELLGRSI